MCREMYRAHIFPKEAPQNFKKYQKGYSFQKTITRLLISVLVYATFTGRFFNTDNSFIAKDEKTMSQAFGIFFTITWNLKLLCSHAISLKCIFNLNIYISLFIIYELL